MPLAIPNNNGLVLANISLATDPQPWAVTFGVTSTDGTHSEGDMDEFVTEIGTAFRTRFKPKYDSAFTLGPVTMHHNDSGVISVFVDTTTEVGTASSATNYLPQNCATLVHKRTALGGRKGRGRMYFPCPDESGVGDDGILTSTYKTGWQTAVDGFLSDFDTIGGPIETHLWLLHTDTGGTEPAPTRITKLQVDPLIATQRRRLRK